MNLARKIECKGVIGRIIKYDHAGKPRIFEKKIDGWWTAKRADLYEKRIPTGHKPHPKARRLARLFANACKDAKDAAEEAVNILDLVVRGAVR